MAERKYSIAEIDLMRIAISDIYQGPSDVRVIEERLRTYMMNGTTVAELEDAARPIRLERMQRQNDWAKGFKPGSMRPVPKPWGTI